MTDRPPIDRLIEQIERLAPGQFRANPDWASLSLFDRTGWRRVRFGDVVANVNETVSDPADAGIERFIGLEHLEPGSLHVGAWGNVADGTTFTRRCRPGQVLFGKRRAYQRKVAVAEFDAVVSGDIYVMQSKDERTLLPDLLPFICLSDRFFEHAVGTSAGSLSPRTNWSSLASFEFNLPPIEQQRRIVSIAAQANDCVRGIETQMTRTNDFRRASLLHAYREGLRPSRMVDTPLGLRPTRWHIAPLKARYDVQLGKMMSPSALSGTGQRPYLRNANVQWNRLDLSDVAMMAFSEREAKKFELEYGDILVCEGRHVGKAAMWRDEIPGACYQKALHRVRAIDPDEVPDWLLHQFEHHALTGIFAETTAETTIPHLPAERLREIHFAFPPKDEQREIATYIRTIDVALERLANHARILGAVLTTFIGSML